MKIRKAILKKQANAGQDILIFVLKFGFNANGESVAIVETEKGDVVTVLAKEIKFLNSPFEEEEYIKPSDEGYKVVKYLI